VQNLGAHNDARMNLSIVLTAIRHGAKAANHVKVEHLLKDENGKLCGAHVRDMVSSLFIISISKHFKACNISL
jgi:glycerol-3-phosphate dehydrogenase